MLKKTVSLILCICLLSTMMLTLCSCKNKKGDEYPVTVAGVTIEEEPLNIVVLSDSLADIISYIGYDVKMVGRSVECDQEFLSVVPLVGTATAPNIDTIISSETDLVIAEDNVPDSVKQQFADNGITLLTLKKPTNFDEMKVLYSDLGTALGGKTTGKEKGDTAYTELFDTLDTYNNAIPTSLVKSACYLYLDETGALCTLTKGTREFDMFAYNGAINVFESQETPQVDLEQLKFATPTCIFYDSEEVLTYLRNNADLYDMAALTNEETFLLKKSDFNRMGTTFEENTYRMIEFMFIEESTPDEATPDDALAETVSETIVGFVE